MKRKEIPVLARVFVIIGALNWGLFGAFELNVLSIIFAGHQTILHIIYMLIGLAGIYELYQMSTIKKS